jgi:hypothetical protein
MPSKKNENKEFVINPNTSRPVKIGSKTWTKLVKDGLIEGADAVDNIAQEQIVGEIDDELEDEVQEKITDLNKEMPVDQQVVKGRGKYKGKLVKRKKAQVNIKEISEQVASAASVAISNNIDQLAETDVDELDDLLKSLIMEELITPASSPVRNTRTRTSRGKYRLQSESETESDESDSD